MTNVSNASEFKKSINSTILWRKLPKLFVWIHFHKVLTISKLTIKKKYLYKQSKPLKTSNIKWKTIRINSFCWDYNIITKLTKQINWI